MAATQGLCRQPLWLLAVAALLLVLLVQPAAAQPTVTLVDTARLLDTSTTRSLALTATYNASADVTIVFQDVSSGATMWINPDTIVLSPTNLTLPGSTIPDFCTASSPTATPGTCNEVAQPGVWTLHIAERPPVVGLVDDNPLAAGTNYVSNQASGTVSLGVLPDPGVPGRGWSIDSPTPTATFVPGEATVGMRISIDNQVPDSTVFPSASNRADFTSFGVAVPSIAVHSSDVASPNTYTSSLTGSFTAGASPSVLTAATDLDVAMFDNAEVRSMTLAFAGYSESPSASITALLPPLTLNTPWLRLKRTEDPIGTSSVPYTITGQMVTRVLSWRSPYQNAFEPDISGQIVPLFDTIGLPYSGSDDFASIPSATGTITGGLAVDTVPNISHLYEIRMCRRPGLCQDIPDSRLEVLPSMTNALPSPDPPVWSSIPMVLPSETGGLDVSVMSRFPLTPFSAQMVCSAWGRSATSVDVPSAPTYTPTEPLQSLIANRLLCQLSSGSLLGTGTPSVTIYTPSGTGTPYTLPGTALQSPDAAQVDLTIFVRRYTVTGRRPMAQGESNPWQTQLISVTGPDHITVTPAAGVSWISLADQRVYQVGRFDFTVPVSSTTADVQDNGVTLVTDIMGPDCESIDPSTSHLRVRSDPMTGSSVGTSATNVQVTTEPFYAIGDLSWLDSNMCMLHSAHRSSNSPDVSLTYHTSRDWEMSFELHVRPFVSSIMPASGQNQLVTLSGVGFISTIDDSLVADGIRVRFVGAGAGASDIDVSVTNWIAQDEIRVITPATIAGSVPVHLSLDGGATFINTAVSYTLPTPTYTLLDPNRGHGRTVTLSGSGFFEGPLGIRVWWPDNTLTLGQLVSPMQIETEAPLHYGSVSSANLLVSFNADTAGNGEPFQDTMLVFEQGVAKDPACSKLTCTECIAAGPLCAWCEGDPGNANSLPGCLTLVQDLDPNVASRACADPAVTSQMLCPCSVSAVRSHLSPSPIDDLQAGKLRCQLCMGLQERPDVPTLPPCGYCDQVSAGAGAEIDAGVCDDTCPFANEEVVDDGITEVALSISGVPELCVGTQEEFQVDPYHNPLFVPELLCRPGTYRRLHDQACVPCPEDTFSFWGYSECYPCPAANAVCVNGTLAVPEGYWCKIPAIPGVNPTPFLTLELFGGRDAEIPVNSAGVHGWALGLMQDRASSLVQECSLFPERCANSLAPGEPAQCCIEQDYGRCTSCLPEYSGPRCESCAFGHYKLGIACRSCPPGATQQLIIVGIIVFILLAFIFLRGPRGSFGVFKISFDFFQVSALFPSFNIPWPPLLLEFFRLFSIFNLDLQVAAPECTVPFLRSEVNRIYLTLGLPLALVGIFSVVGLVRWPINTFLSLVTGRQVGGLDNSSNVINTSIRGFVTFFQFSYLFLALKSLAILDCTRQTDGTWAWEGSPGLCWGAKDALDSSFAESDWTRAAYASFPGIVFYAFAVPLLVRYLMKKQASQLGNPSVIDRYGPVFFLYVPWLYQWEFWVMIRKLTMGMIVLFLTRRQHIQLVLSLLATTVSLYFAIRYRPYKLYVHTALDISLLVVQEIVLLVGASVLTVEFDSGPVGPLIPRSSQAYVVMETLAATAIVLAIVLIFYVLYWEFRARYVARSESKKLKKARKKAEKELKETARQRAQLAKSDPKLAADAALVNDDTLRATETAETPAVAAAAAVDASAGGVALEPVVRLTTKSFRHGTASRRRSDAAGKKDGSVRRRRRSSSSAGSAQGSDALVAAAASTGDGSDASAAPAPAADSLQPVARASIDSDRSARSTRSIDMRSIGSKGAFDLTGRRSLDGRERVTYDELALLNRYARDEDAGVWIPASWYGKLLLFPIWAILMPISRVFARHPVPLSLLTGLLLLGAAVPLFLLYPWPDPESGEEPPRLQTSLGTVAVTLAAALLLFAGTKHSRDRRLVRARERMWTLAALSPASPDEIKDGVVVEVEDDKNAPVQLVMPASVVDSLFDPTKEYELNRPTQPVRPVTFKNSLRNVALVSLFFMILGFVPQLRAVISADENDEALLQLAAEVAAVVFAFSVAVWLQRMLTKRRRRQAATRGTLAGSMVYNSIAMLGDPAGKILNVESTTGRRKRKRREKRRRAMEQFLSEEAKKGLMTDDTPVPWTKDERRRLRDGVRRHGIATHDAWVSTRNLVGQSRSVPDCIMEYALAPSTTLSAAERARLANLKRQFIREDRERAAAEEAQRAAARANVPTISVATEDDQAEKPTRPTRSGSGLFSVFSSSKKTSSAAPADATAAAGSSAGSAAAPDAAAAVEAGAAGLAAPSPARSTSTGSQRSSGKRGGGLLGALFGGDAKSRPAPEPVPDPTFVPVVQDSGVAGAEDPEATSAPSPDDKV